MTELTCFSWAVLCFYCINIMLFIVILGQVGIQHDGATLSRQNVPLKSK